MEIKSQKDVQINYFRRSNNFFAPRDFIIYSNLLILLCETKENIERLFLSKEQKIKRVFIRKLTYCILYDPVKSE